MKNNKIHRSLDLVVMTKKLIFTSVDVIYQSNNEGIQIWTPELEYHERIQPSLLYHPSHHLRWFGELFWHCSFDTLAYTWKNNIQHSRFWLRSVSFRHTSMKGFFNSTLSGSSAVFSRPRYGLVWMCMYSSQSTCVEVDWSGIKLNSIPFHSNTCGLRWIHMHPNKA